MSGAAKILALPELAQPSRPSPQSWHTGEFGDKKCVNATRDSQ